MANECMELKLLCEVSCCILVLFGVPDIYFVVVNIYDLRL